MAAQGGVTDREAFKQWVHKELLPPVILVVGTEKAHEHVYQKNGLSLAELFAPFGGYTQDVPISIRTHPEQPQKVTFAKSYFDFVDAAVIERLTDDESFWEKNLAGTGTVTTTSGQGPNVNRIEDLLKEEVHDFGNLAFVDDREFPGLLTLPESATHGPQADKNLPAANGLLFGGSPAGTEDVSDSHSQSTAATKNSQNSQNRTNNYVQKNNNNNISRGGGSSSNLNSSRLLSTKRFGRSSSTNNQNSADMNTNFPSVSSTAVPFSAVKTAPVWFARWRKLYVNRCLRFAPAQFAVDQLGQHFASVVVVLSTETEVVARFQQLVSAPMQPKFFRNGTLDVNPPRLKVLLHDLGDPKAPNTKTVTEILNGMQQAFVPHTCAVLAINRQTSIRNEIGSKDADSRLKRTREIFARHVSRAASLGPLPGSPENNNTTLSTAGGDDKGDLNGIIQKSRPEVSLSSLQVNPDKLTDEFWVARALSLRGENYCRNLTMADCTTIQALVQDCIQRVAVPYAEKRLHWLDEQIEQKRRGAMNQLKYLAWRKPKGGTDEDGSSNGKKKPIYPASSVEAQLRACGDLCFMLRDYSRALSHYKILATDLKQDKSWGHLGACYELMAVCHYLTEAERLSETEVERNVQMAAEAYSKTSSGGGPNRYNARLNVFYTAMCPYLTPKRVATHLTKTDFLSEPLLTRALFLEHCANLYALAGHRRKSAFQLVLAGHTFHLGGFKKLNLYCYQKAVPTFSLSGVGAPPSGAGGGEGSLLDSWVYIRDHLNFTMGRYSHVISLHGTSSHYFYQLCHGLYSDNLNSNCRHQIVAADREKMYLSEFCIALKAWLKAERLNSMKESPTLLSEGSQTVEKDQGSPKNGDACTRDKVFTNLHVPKLELASKDVYIMCAGDAPPANHSRGARRARGGASSGANSGRRSSETPEVRAAFDLARRCLQKKTALEDEKNLDKSRVSGSSSSASSGENNVGFSKNDEGSGVNAVLKIAAAANTNVNAAVANVDVLQTASSSKGAFFEQSRSDITDASLTEEDYQEIRRKSAGEGLRAFDLLNFNQIRVAHPAAPLRFALVYYNPLQVAVELHDIRLKFLFERDSLSESSSAAREDANDSVDGEKTQKEKDIALYSKSLERVNFGPHEKKRLLFEVDLISENLFAPASGHALCEDVSSRDEMEQKGRENGPSENASVNVNENPESEEVAAQKKMAELKISAEKTSSFHTVPSSSSSSFTEKNLVEQNLTKSSSSTQKSGFLVLDGVAWRLQNEVNVLNPVSLQSRRAAQCQPVWHRKKRHRVGDGRLLSRTGSVGSFGGGGARGSSKSLGGSYEKLDKACVRVDDQVLGLTLEPVVSGAEGNNAQHLLRLTVYGLEKLAANRLDDTIKTDFYVIAENPVLFANFDGERAENAQREAVEFLSIGEEQMKSNSSLRSTSSSSTHSVELPLLLPAGASGGSPSQAVGSQQQVCRFLALAVVRETPAGDAGKHSRHRKPPPIRRWALARMNFET